MNPYRCPGLYNSLSALDFQWVWTEHVCSSLDLLCDNAWLKAGGQRSSLAGARDHTHPYKCIEASAVHAYHFSGSHTQTDVSFESVRDAQSQVHILKQFQNNIIDIRDKIKNSSFWETERYNLNFSYKKKCKYKLTLIKLKSTDCFKACVWVK